MAVSSVSASVSSQASRPSPHLAALKIQAHYRGWIIRKANSSVKLEQILPIITQNGLPLDANYDAVVELVSKINSMSANQKKYQGKSLPVQDNLVSTLGLKILWIEMSPHGKRIDLLMVPLGSQLAKGSYQTVYKAHKFSIPLLLNSNKERLVKYTPSALKRIPIVEAYDKNRVNITQEYHKQAVTVRNTGVIAQSKLLKCLEKIPEAKIAHLPRFRNPQDPPKEGPPTVEDNDMEQTWYNGTLSYFALGSVPTNLLDNSSRRKLELSDGLNAVLDIAKTLMWLTRCSVAHCDLTKDNIVLYLQNGVIHSALIDFDLQSTYGNYKHVNLTPNNFSDYAYWDSLAKCNIITPIVDIHGLLVSFLFCLFPKIEEEARCLKDIKECGLTFGCLANSTRYFQLLNALEKKIERFNQKEKEAIRKVFLLFKHVHKKTIELVIYLRPKPALVEELQGPPEEKRRALSQLEKVLLTPEEIEHYKNAYQEIEGLEAPFLYNLKIIHELETIKRELD